MTVAEPTFLVQPLPQADVWRLSCDTCGDGITCETPEVGDMLKLHFVMKHRDVI